MTGFLKRLFGGAPEEEQRRRQPRDKRPQKRWLDEPPGVRAERLLRLETDSLDERKEALAEHHRLFGRFVERNLEGRRLEKAGDVDAAIELYEANVADMAITTHPYERLRIIYRKRHEYGKALAVCEKYLEMLKRQGRPGGDEHFESWCEKLEAKLAEDE